MKTFILQLDLPPKDRWVDIINEQFTNFITVQKYFNANMEKNSYFTQKLISSIISTVKFDTEYIDEIDGILKTLLICSKNTSGDPLKSMTFLA